MTSLVIGSCVTTRLLSLRRADGPAAAAAAAAAASVAFVSREYLLFVCLHGHALLPRSTHGNSVATPGIPLETTPWPPCVAYSSQFG